MKPYPVAEFFARAAIHSGRSIFHRYTLKPATL
jgi:hypothetical protein